jgi:hypothetical protein
MSEDKLICTFPNPVVEATDLRLWYADSERCTALPWVSRGSR